MDSSGLIPWKPAGPDYQPTPKMRREQTVVRRFDEEKKRQDLARQEYHRIRLAAALHMKAKQRRIIYETFEKQLEKSRLERTYNFAVHTATRDAWRKLEQLDLASMVVVQQRVFGEISHHDIATFESKGYELGADPKPEEAAPAGKKAPPPKKSDPPPPPTTVDPALLAERGKAYLEDVKARKSKEGAESLETRQSKRKEELERQARERELEEAGKKEEQDQTGKKRQEEELRQAEIIRMAEAEEQSLIAYRNMLEQHLNEKRNREWDAVLARDRELLMMMRQDCVEEVEHEHQRVEAEKKRKAETRKARHREMCREVMLQILSLAESVAYYRETAESDLPMMEWREWQSLFVKGAIQPSRVNPVVYMESQTAEANLIADDAAVMEYFQEQGEWFGPQKAGKNQELGIILGKLHWQADPPPKPVPIPNFSRMTLKLVIVGTPYSGKTLVASKIAADFGITLIETDKVIAAAIAEAEAEEATQENAEALANGEREARTPEAGTVAPPTKAQLGKDMKSYKQLGKDIPDHLVATLLVLTVSSLEFPEDEAGDQKKAPPKKQDKKGGGKTGEIEMNVTGFVIDGFPATAGQAAAFEKALTGLDLEFTARHQAAASLLAPPPPVEKVEKYVSGVDGLFLMKCPSEELALKRALGKRVDSKTGLFYHLDFDPPPATDKTGISSRLQPVEEPDAARIRIIEGMQGWPSLSSWIEMFRNSYGVGYEGDGKVRPDDAVAVVSEFVEARKLAEVAAAAAKAAKEAEEATNAASAETEKAKLNSDIATKQLYMAKLAEIEAAAVLESFPADPLAKEILKVKASTMAGQKLNDAVKALKEIQGAVEMAQKAASQSQAAAEKAKEAAAGADACFQAQVEAEAAAEVAKQAALRAAQTSEKAHFTYDTASEELDKVAKPEAAARPKDVPKQEAPVESTQSAPSDSSYLELNSDAAARLHGVWKEIESLYFSDLRDLFHDFRVERSNGRNVLQEIKLKFGEFLRRPDNKQQIFGDFQEKYNRVELAQRRTPKMKPILKKMVDELSKQLRTICDNRLKEAQENSKKSLAEWISQRTASCVSLFTRLMQIEIDRHLQACSFLHEYYFQRPGAAVMDAVGPTSKLMQNAVDPPKTFPIPGWIAAITPSSPQIAQTLSRGIFLIDSILKRASNPQLEFGTASAGKKAKPGEAVEINLENVPLAIRREHEIIQCRMQLLGRFLHLILVFCLCYSYVWSRLLSAASKACAYVGELQPLLNGSSKRMEDWMNNCYKTESGIVAEVIDLAEEAVEENIPLWYHMNLGGGELVIDQSQIVVEPPPPMTVEPVVDFNRWHFGLLEELARVFGTSSPTGYMEVKGAVSAMQEAIDNSRNKGKEDANLCEIPHLPATKSNRPGGLFQIWTDYLNRIIKVPSEAEETQFIDWRALVMTLADMHFNGCISASSADDVSRVCNSLEQTGKETGGLLNLEAFLSVRFWFDQDTYQGAVDIGANLKKLAYQLLQPPAAAPPAKGRGAVSEQPAITVPWQKLALYFCRDENASLALTKVFLVLSRGGPKSSLELKPGGLLQAIYHLDVEQASQAGCLTWSPEDLRELVLKIKCQQGKSSSDEPDGGVESDGSQTGKLCVHSTAGQRGSNLSDNSSVSLKDFGVEEPDTTSLEATLDVGEMEAELNEQGVETIKEFLESLTPPAGQQQQQQQQQQATNSVDDERLVSVKEILRAQCAANLRSVLVDSYCSKRLHVMSLKKAAGGDRPRENFAK